jgi:hypothetical protein
MLHANLMNFGVDYISPSAGSYRRYWFSIRCFKN